MSIETWKQEFYSEDASEYKEGKTAKQSVEHSLKKWRGLTTENLERHNIDAPNLTTLRCEGEDSVFEVTGETCALCKKYDYECEVCPLAAVRGGAPCDTWCPDGDFPNAHAPYQQFTLCKDPQPMIRWLEAALQYTTKKENTND